ncbi:putative 3TM holin [compost metagenome]
MVDPFTAAAASICAAICVRIVCYRREGARYRLGVSALAYLLAVGTGCYSLTVTIDVLRGYASNHAVSPWLLLVLLVVAILIYRAKGNVARIISEGPWNGVDRRRG